MEEHVRELQQEKERLQQKLSDPEVLRDAQKLKTLSMQFSKIEKELRDYERFAEVERRIRETRQLEKGTTDEELQREARTELRRLETEKSELEKRLNREETKEPQNLILEIRAGAGGNEAGLFAGELFTMYHHFADRKGWETVLLYESKTDLGGCKEAAFEMNGAGAYSTLRWESGVHRVQRIPATEKSGRIHTSTASVAVLPQARDVDIEMKPQDVKIEFFRSSGPGGQNVNKVETAVRIYHLPTGLVVTSQESRSQQKNRENAMTLLRSRLLDAKLQEEAKKIAAQRRQQIGSGDRSEKIRTYNFPQDRVTDHRIKQSWHNLESILAGGLEPIVEALQDSINVTRQG